MEIVGEKKNKHQIGLSADNGKGKNVKSKFGILRRTLISLTDCLDLCGPKHKIV